jgi:phenylacetyl-CoA:acceptor oxidoreductase
VAALDIEDGDLVEVCSPLNATRGRAIVRTGIRPNALLIMGQFDHSATPFAKDLHQPSMNKLVPMLFDLTDATGSAADLVKAQIKRVGTAPVNRGNKKGWLSRVAERISNFGLGGK